jgi:hypothetical protein
MGEYRAYAIGHDGHIFKSAALICEDDKQAIEQAEAAFDNCTIGIESRPLHCPAGFSGFAGTGLMGPQLVCWIFPAGEKVKEMRTGLPSKLE